MMMGLGKEKIRELPTLFSGDLPPHCERIHYYLPGTLIVQTVPYENSPDRAASLAKSPAFTDWSIILLVDNCEETTCSLQEFLWTFFTRFEPAADIHGTVTTVERFHVGLTAPIVFDCRMKPWYTDLLEVDEATRNLVDSRISQLLPSNLY